MNGRLLAAGNSSSLTLVCLTMACCLVIQSERSSVLIADDTNPSSKTQADDGGVKQASFEAPVGAGERPHEAAGFGDDATKRPPAKSPLVALPEPKSKPTKPQVILSESHVAISNHVVGDEFPELTVQNLAGNETKVSDWYGEKLTLVVFWSHEHVYATEQFSRLADEIVSPFQRTGLSVVAIHVGDDVKAVKGLRDQYPGNFACLVDPNGGSFAKVAETKIPRTYLVGSTGKIVWLDLEYSRAMRRQVDNAIRYYLQDAPAGK